jgi:hypothetical protein
MTDERRKKRDGPMPDRVPDPTVPPEQVKLARIRLHAETIRAMTASASPKDASGNAASNVRTWRALAVSHGECVSYKLAMPGNTLGYAEVQRRFTDNSSLASQSVSNATIGLTPEEIAVFFGLDDVDPAEISWREITVRTPSQLYVAQGGLNTSKLN